MADSTMATAARSAAADHRRLVAALCDPAPYGPDVTRVEHIETHISDVFLSGRHAYKIKKPVALGFLDFTTLAARHAFCLGELRLNRRLAPALYLDVVPITGTPARPEIGGAGPVIEYAVKMREFPQDALASRVLERGELTAQHVDALAADVAAFHGRVAVAGADGRFGEPVRILDTALQNFDQILPLRDDPAAQSTISSLRDWTRAEHAVCADAFAMRRHGGFVRECHGDLHLGNIALIDGRMTIFDCIEFNDELRWIDVMSEVAFAVMDLMGRQRPDLGWRFLDRWLEITGDHGGVAVLRFYLVYRAMVRAKVTCLRAAQLAPGDARCALLAEHGRYVELARHCARPPRRAIIVTHGLSGSGKSTLTQALLEGAGAIRVRTDVERRRLAGLGAAARSGSSLGAGMYSEAATQATYRRVATLVRGIVNAGHVAIADGTFLQRAQRDLLRRLAADLGVPFAIASFAASPETLRERIARRARAGTDASEADLAVLAHQLRTQEPLAEDECIDVVAIDAEAPIDRLREMAATRPLLDRLEAGIAGA